MKLVKRIVTAAAVTAVAAASLVGCAGANSSDASTLKMLVPTYSDNTKGLWEKVIKGFEEKHPEYKVELEVVSWENLDSVVANRIQGGQAPDIYNGGDFTSFVADELLYPIADVVSKETLDDFTDSFIDNASVDGVQYGAPLIASARALFANKDLMEKAGIAEMPKTWDELQDAALKISALDGDFHGYGLPLGSEEAQAEAAIWFYGGGGGYGDAKELTINSDENIAAAEHIRAMVEAGATQPDAQASQRTPLMDVFVQGKIGFQIGLPPTVQQIASTNPDLNYEIGAIPTKDGSAFTLGVADHLVAFNNDNGAKQEAITAFFDYFYSTEYVDWVTTEGFLPTTESGNEQMSSNEDIAPFLELLPDAKFYPSANPNWQAAAEAMKKNFGLILSEDPASVLENIQQTAEQG